MQRTEQTINELYAICCMDDGQEKCVFSEDTSLIFPCFEEAKILCDFLNAGKDEFFIIKFIRETIIITKENKESNE